MAWCFTGKLLDVNVELLHSSAYDCTCPFQLWEDLGFHGGALRIRPITHFLKLFHNMRCQNQTGPICSDISAFWKPRFTMGLHLAFGSYFLLYAVALDYRDFTAP